MKTAMPLMTDRPILSFDSQSLRNIDTRNSTELYSLYAVFSKCAHSMEDGQRLSNLSWRLWNREILCTTTKSHSARLQNSFPVPELVSSSLDSDSSDEDSLEDDQPNDSDSYCFSYRGKEKHITPVGLQRIVASIKENQTLEPLSPLPRSLAHPYTAPRTDSTTTPRVTPILPTSAVPDSSTSTIATAQTDTSNMSPVGSAPSTATDLSSHSIVRGFRPGTISSSFRSKEPTSNNSNTPTSMLQRRTPENQPDLSDGQRKEAAIFTVDSSSSSPTETATLQQVTPEEQPDQIKKKAGATFMFGGGSSDEEAESSLEAHMRGALIATKSPTSSNKLTAPKEEVTMTAEANDSSAIESDDEDGISESAIEDEDDDDDEDEDDAWEDDDEVCEAVEDENKSPPQAQAQSQPPQQHSQTFERVGSSVNLVSRRSLLTMQMSDPQAPSSASHSTPALRRSRTSTPNGPSLATSPQEAPLEMRAGQARSRPIIMTTSNTHPPALSPRTTRRNMFSTELTESLRKNLLWERQQKNSTSNAANAAALKRRHTSNDVKSLQNYPDAKAGRLPTVRESSKGVNSWNHYFDTGLQEYHEKGW